MPSDPARFLAKLRGEPDEDVRALRGLGIRDEGLGFRDGDIQGCIGQHTDIHSCTYVYLSIGICMSIYIYTC